MKSLRKAFMYDFFSVRGGAESLTVKFHERFPNFSIIIGAINPTLRSSFKIKKNSLVVLSRFISLPVITTIYYSRVFEKKTKFLKNYDVVVYSGSVAPLAAINQIKGKKIYYCHTPPRFIYDLKLYYKATIPKLFHPVYELFCNWFERKYLDAISQMDYIVCNSKNISHRVSKYLGRDSEVIYPPCDTEKFYWSEPQEYYLSTARLEKYKRVDLIIKAFKQLPEKKLVIVSGGSQHENLKSLAAGCENVTILGWCSDTKLVELMSRCIATIYIPVDEDFGISPVESLASGKPVIGVRDGGIVETVEHLKTGYLCSIKSLESDLINGIQFLDRTKSIEWSADCMLSAKRFGVAQFNKNFEKLFSKFSKDKTT